MFSAVGLQSITKTALATFLEQRQDRIVAAEEHVVIQVVINPLLHGFFDIAEVDEHAA